MIRQLLKRNRFERNRRGVSILEVLFAIMISAIGLMGAIAVFPAALMQTKRGQQADMTATAGQACYHTFDAMGMRRADRWLYWEPSPSPGPARYMRVAPPDGSAAYCIDPRFVTANPNSTVANLFPHGSSVSLMRRVTLDNGANTINPTQMLSPQANLVFGIEDDLAYDRFTGTFNGIDQSTQQAASLFARDSSGTVLKRESHGHMSWMATLSPKIDRLQVPTGTVEDRYVLSLVVFYDRPVQLEATAGYDASEWELTVSNSYGGGEMQLQVPSSGTFAVPATNPEEQFRRVNIHRDQWIMLSRNQVTSGPRADARRFPICRWYRVIDSDEPDGNSVNVTLAGADLDPNDTLTAVIAQGVVAVFEKTIKLEPRN